MGVKEERRGRDADISRSIGFVIVVAITLAFFLSPETVFCY